MKLSKPEDMDELDEPLEPETTTEPGEVRTVEAFGEEMVLEAAVQVIAEMVEKPDDFGIATTAEMRELRETIEQQRLAIAELADAFEKLAANQGQIAHDDPEAPATVRLDSKPLTGIYDPTEEF